MVLQVRGPEEGRLVAVLDVAGVAVAVAAAFARE